MGVATRMRQSLASFEEAFAQQAEDDRERAEALRRQAIQRTRQRHREKAHKHGSLRFVVLILVLLATAVLVTVAMFETLYLVMG
jgi:membrane glycosyltransferase